MYILLDNNKGFNNHFDLFRGQHYYTFGCSDKNKFRVGDDIIIVFNRGNTPNSTKIISFGTITDIVNCTLHMKEARWVSTNDNWHKILGKSIMGYKYYMTKDKGEALYHKYV